MEKKMETTILYWDYIGVIVLIFVRVPCINHRGIFKLFEASFCSLSLIGVKVGNFLSEHCDDVITRGL